MAGNGTVLDINYDQNHNETSFLEQSLEIDPDATLVVEDIKNIIIITTENEDIKNIIISTNNIVSSHDSGDSSDENDTYEVTDSVVQENHKPVSTSAAEEAGLSRVNGIAEEKTETPVEATGRVLRSRVPKKIPADTLSNPTKIELKKKLTTVAEKDSTSIQKGKAKTKAAVKKEVPNLPAVPVKSNRKGIQKLGASVVEEVPQSSSAAPLKPNPKGKSKAISSVENEKEKDPRKGKILLPEAKVVLTKRAPTANPASTTFTSVTTKAKKKEKNDAGTVQLSQTLPAIASASTSTAGKKNSKSAAVAAGSSKPAVNGTSKANQDPPAPVTESAIVPDDLGLRRSKRQKKKISFFVSYKKFK